MKVLGLIIISLLVSCAQPSNLTTVEKEVVVTSMLENVKCYSNGNYTECSIVNNAVRILSVNARVNEDCTKDIDYYLLDEKTLVVINKCKAVFLLEVEN